MITYEYLVIDMIDEGGKVNVASLQDKLNRYGQEGWHLVSAYSNELGKNALVVAGLGINSTADQNILILERTHETETYREKFEREREAEKLKEEFEREAKIKEKLAEKEKRERTEKENEAVKSYIEAQLKKDSLSEILRLQEQYFNTTSLAFMKNIVPDATVFSDAEEYKSELAKLM